MGKKFLSLVEKADVVVENFRPGVMDKLGLGFNKLKEINSRLVYAAISGFGNPQFGKSPYTYWPSYDVVAQAMGELLALLAQIKILQQKLVQVLETFFWANDVIWDYLCHTYS